MTPVRAPAGAVCWSPDRGWVFDQDEAAHALTENGWSLVVASDGRVHVDVDETAPLASVLRVDGDLVEIVQRLDDLGDQVAGLDVGEATDKAEFMVRLRALADRVAALEAAT